MFYCIISKIHTSEREGKMLIGMVIGFVVGVLATGALAIRKGPPLPGGPFRDRNHQAGSHYTSYH